MNKKNHLLTPPLLLAALLAVGGCASSYQNEVMFARIEGPLTQEAVDRERANPSTNQTPAPLYGRYSTQDLRLSSFAMFNCSTGKAGENAAYVYSDAALVPPGITVQQSDIVAIEMGGGTQPTGGAHPHRILKVYSDKEAMDLEADRVNNIQLVRCNQNAYIYGHYNGQYPHTYGHQ